ncbi:MAG TPA: glycerophosphodiester phosphodiesterase family protein [Sphingomicrobium sp.]
MRSSRSGPDPLDPGPAGFAHRGLHSGAAFPENSLIAFAAALERGAGIECDLRLTADDRIVVFHDADAWRLCASPMRIGQSTLADLGRLSIGNHPIPTLESLLTLVAGRVPLLLEVKVADDVWRWARALRAALGEYGGAFGVMSFDPRIARLVKTSMPDVRRGLVIRDQLPSWRRRIALWLADADFAAVERAALGKAWVGRLRRRMPVYSWTIRTAGQRAQAAVQADALIWEGDGRPRA